MHESPLLLLFIIKLQNKSKIIGIGLNYRKTNFHTQDSHNQFHHTQEPISLSTRSQLRSTS